MFRYKRKSSPLVAVVEGIGPLVVPEIGNPFIEVGFLDKIRGVREKFQLVLAGFGDAVELKVLEDVVGKTSYTVTAPTYLALAEADPGEAATGASLTESNYTGYQRKSVAAADWNSAAAGAISTANVLTFANCTGGSSVVTNWALCSAGPARLTAADVIFFGTCTSTTINTTQTPPTVAAGALSATLD